METRIKDLNYYLAREYPYTVLPDGGAFFVNYPDLPGCMTQVEDAADIPAMAQEIKELWLETALEDRMDISEPVTSDYSGKFVVRLPKTLHQSLAYRAEQEGVSLNSYVVHLLGERSSVAAIQQALVQQVGEMNKRVESLSAHDTYQVEVTQSEDELSLRRRGKLQITANVVAV